MHWPKEERIVKVQRRSSSPSPVSGPARRQETAEARTQVVLLTDPAYEAIKHHIITCRFAPGESLNEAQVAERLKLSRMPVHQLPNVQRRKTWPPWRKPWSVPARR